MQIMRWLIERKITVSFGLALSVLIAVSAASCLNWIRFRTSTGAVEHTYRVIDNLEKIQSQLKDAETGQRGYLLTGDDRYLTPYRSALQAIQSEFETLRQLMVDDPVQQQRLDQLDRFIREKLAELRETITLRQTQGLEASLRVVETDRGKQVMDEIRQLTETMEVEEQALLQQRSQAADDRARSTALFIILGSGLAIVLVVVALYLINRNIARRQNIEAQIRTLNLELENRVVERTAQLERANQAKDALLQREQAARTEAELAQAQTSRVLERLSDGFVVLNQNWQITYANPAAVNILQTHGLSRSQQELFNQTLWQVFPAAVGTSFEQEFRRAVAEQTKVEFEAFYQPLDLWLQVNAYPSEDGLSIYFQDITDRKRSESLLQQSESRFRRLSEANIIGVIVGNFQGEVLEANHAFLQLVGYSQEDLDQGRIEWDRLTPAEWSPLDLDAQAQMQQTGSCVPYEKEYLRADGSRVPVLVGAALVEGSEDKAIAFVLDLSDRKHMETVLRQQALELEQANRLKDDFLAMVSHELRTPLNSVLGWSQLLLGRGFEQTMVQRGLESIQRNAQLQKHIVEDILDVSRIIRGQLHMTATAQNLIPIIHTAIDAVHPAADAKQIQITSVLNPAVGAVLGSADRLQQIVWNLLSNAIKFTPKGGQVEVHLERVSSEIELRIRDSGIGIDPEFLPYVFDRFRQADSSTTRSYSGLGLGLTIVRQLVELHGGTVRAESPGQGQGATFIVRFPVLAVQSPAPETAPWMVRDQIDLSELILQGVKVLVVDDEADAREMIAIALETYGAEVTIAGSTAEALEIFDRVQPDVLVSDIGMPGENGYVLIRRLRDLEAERGSQIPAIALTAYAQEEDRRQVLRAGFQTHLAKPIEPDALVLAIGSLIQRT